MKKGHEGLDFELKVFKFQRPLTGRDDFAEADPPVRNVIEVGVKNHEILTCYGLHLWSQLLLWCFCTALPDIV